MLIIKKELCLYRSQQTWFSKFRDAKKKKKKVCPLLSLENLFTLRSLRLLDVFLIHEEWSEKNCYVGKLKNLILSSI